MKHVSYTIKYTRKRAGKIVEVAVLLEEGEKGESNNFIPERFLGKHEMPFMSPSLFMMRGRKTEAAIFTAADFGDTSDEDDVILFLNQRLAADTTRAKVNPQDIVDSVASVKAARGPQ